MKLKLSSLSMEELLGYSRLFLIRARATRQTATIMSDFSRPNPQLGLVDNVQALFTISQIFRLKGKQCLQEIERRNGELFLEGKRTFPLSETLNGKLFMYWDEYMPEYNKSKLFQGVDPEL